MHHTVAKHENLQTQGKLTKFSQIILNIGEISFLSKKILFRTIPTRKENLKENSLFLSNGLMLLPRAKMRRNRRYSTCVVPANSNFKTPCRGARNTQGSTLLLAFLLLKFNLGKHFYYTFKIFTFSPCVSIEYLFNGRVCIEWGVEVFYVKQT